jgi:methylated-DNA-[protein]-cysteine S-methyltransferase
MIDIYIKNVEGFSLGVAYDGESVYATSFGPDEESALRGLLGSIPLGVPFQQSQKASAFCERVVVAVKDIYDGKDASPNFSLATRHLPVYTRRVIEATYLIPTGYVTSYGLIAKAVGGGPRAVGNVMAMNPFSPIVPCHRVVRTDLTLGGYGGGLDVKLQILKRERRGYAAEKEIPVDGKKLRLSPVEFVLKKISEA